MNKEKGLVLKTSPMRWLVCSSWNEKTNEPSIHFIETFMPLLYSPRSAPRDQTTNRLFIVLSCLTQKLNQYSSCFCFHAQCSVFSAVLAWCRGWDSWATIDTSASKSSIRKFVITEKAPTRAFSWLKAATTAFTFKTLLRDTMLNGRWPHGK